MCLLAIYNDMRKASAYSSLMVEGREGPEDFPFNYIVSKVCCCEFYI